MNLSEKQKQIVESHAKYCYVVAGAGSGKTRTLTEHIKVLLERSIRGEKVLALTFSNKAANELKDRLLLSYSEAEIEEKIYVGTIHNFCMDLILQRGASIGLSSDLHIFEDYGDRLEIFVEAIQSTPQFKDKCTLSDGMLDSKKVRNIFDQFGKAKRNLRFPSDYGSKPATQMLYQEYENRMLAQNAIDFDDILLFAYRILIEKESIARIYQHVYKNICIDEAQDLNKSQYEVIKAIAGATSSIFMVGDPNQAIYGFNGSSSSFMMKRFPADYPGVAKFELFENYRSSQAILKAAQAIEPNFSMSGILPIRGELECMAFDDEESEAEWIIERIEYLVNNGHPDIEGNCVTLEQCAVLARNKYVFNALESLLDQRNIEYRLRASAARGLNSESTLFQVFDLSLRLLINPKDALHLAELQSLIGAQAAETSSFQEMETSHEMRTALGEKGFTLLRNSWNILAKRESFHFEKVLDMFSAFCSEPSNFDSDDERSLSMKDYLDWKQTWKRYCMATTLDERTLSHMMRSIALGTADSTEDAKGLTLSTVHMSKGLEYDVVFVMGLTEGTFPDYRALNNTSQLAEEQHNMFVAITRSKRLCYLTYSKNKLMPWGSMKYQHPSRYLCALGYTE